MKRIICILFVFALLFPVFSLADLPDISSLTYDELVQLKDKLNLAIWNSKEWQEVTVPAGIWEVGVDIPAGHWTVTPGDYSVAFWYGDKLNEGKTDVGRGWDYETGVSLFLSGRVDKDGNWKYSEYQHQVSVDMKEGFYVKVDADVVFTPYSGKPDLGFK